jgi:hypothetical protein
MNERRDEISYERDEGEQVFPLGLAREYLLTPPFNEIAGYLSCFFVCFFSSASSAARTVAAFSSVATT